MKSLVLIDGRNLAYRSHFTNKTRNGAVYGFGANIIDITNMAQSRDVVVAWDDGVPGTGPGKMLWRKRLDARYKSNRNLDDTERKKIEAQLPKIAQLVRLAGYAQVGVPGVEADDLISITAWRLASKPLWPHLHIYSNDEDYYALLRHGLTILQPNRHGGLKRVTLADLTATGQTPDEYGLAKALSGCTSDTVPGIPKCGAVHALRAVKLGADPRKTWDEQPEAYREKYPQHAAHWHEAQRGLELTRLPRAAKDVPGHGDEIHQALSIIPHLSTGRASTEGAVKRATRLIEWLHAEGLEVLAMRRAMLVNPNDYPVEL